MHSQHDCTQGPQPRAVHTMSGWAARTQSAPWFKKKGGRERVGVELLFSNVFLQKASSLGYSSQLGMEMLRSDNI